MGYGWCLEKKTSVAVPLVLHFFTGYTSIVMLNSTQTLLVDLLPSQGSSVTACNNFIRCSLAAVLVSVVDIADKSLGPGWAFVLFGGLCVLVAPLLYVVVRIGPRCRQKRLAQ
ncbi:hypothetical protein HGRIS_004765 [Hohenbuehelia grisea]|uniref:Uncharacterized protein n=1 Tax=Hohenbuehelia grisea TaxID=104357 RepID=A0ABR3JDR8_9AGAR